MIHTLRNGLLNDFPRRLIVTKNALNYWTGKLMNQPISVNKKVFCKWLHGHRDGQFFKINASGTGPMPGILT